MAVKITYFVHGTTRDNLERRYTGWHDAELAPIGEQQSHDLRKHLEGQEFDVVICSDLKRAVRSAEIAFGDKAPIIKDARLRECHLGSMDRSKTDDIDPVLKSYISTPFPGGESYADVERRMRDLVNDIKSNHDGKRVAIVAHRAPQLALDVILKGKTWEQAIDEDWRHKKQWQPGWEYEL